MQDTIVIRPFLIGVAAGPRSMIPLAVVSAAARRGGLADDNGAPALLANPIFSAAVMAFAAGEAVGDKLPFAPDRIIVPGLAARVVTGGLAGAALAPRGRRRAAAALGAAGAVGAAYLSFAIRARAMRRFGQVPTGIVEDAMALGAALMIVNGAAGNRDSLY